MIRLIRWMVLAMIGMLMIMGVLWILLPVDHVPHDAESLPARLDQMDQEHPSELDVIIPTTPFEPSSHILVKVVSTDGQSIPAMLAFEGYEIICNARGEATIPVSWQHITVRHARHIPVRVPITESIRRAGTVKVILRQGAVLHGVVLDMQRQPIPGALVSASVGGVRADVVAAGEDAGFGGLGFSTGGPPATYAAWTRSGDDGSFELCGLRRVPHVVIVHKAGFIPDSRNGAWSVTPDGTRVSFLLRRLFVGVLEIQGPPDVVDPDLWKRVSLTYKNPPGLTAVPSWMFSEVERLAGRIRAICSPGSVLSIILAETGRAVPPSQVEVEARWIGHDGVRLTVGLHFAQDWTHGDATVFSIADSYDVGRLEIRSPLPVIAHPMEGKRPIDRFFPGYTPTTTDDDRQVFLLPCGDYLVRYRMGRFLESSVPAARTAISKDEVRSIDLSDSLPSMLLVKVLDAAGNPTSRYRIRLVRDLVPLVLAGRSDAILRIPVHPGKYTLELMDWAGTVQTVCSINVRPEERRHAIDLRIR